MEGSDAFGGGVEAPEDDPFAGADLEFAQDDPLGPDDPTSVEALRTVDGEGREITETTETSQPGDGETQVVGGAAPGEELPGAHEERFVPGAVAAATTAAEAASEAQPEADPTPAPTDGGQAAQSAATTEQSGSGSEPSADQEGGVDPTQRPASETPEGSPAAADASAPAAQTSPSPASATGPGDGNGSAAASDGEPDPNKRPYKIFVPEGDGKFAEVRWFEDRDGNMVAKGTKGAKERAECVVRSKEEALRVGYAALGAEGEASLIVVASSQWKVKKVKPTTEQIPRVRLQIS